MQLGQTQTLRAAFASSTYLLVQIPGPGRSSDDDLLNSRIIQTYFFRGHPLSKGAIRACGLSIAAGPSLPASSGPASDDALVILRSDFFAMLCCCPKTRRSARPLRPPRICCRKYPDPLVSIPLTPFSRGHIRPLCAPERMATASLFFGRHLMMPWQLFGRCFFALSSPE